MCKIKDYIIKKKQEEEIDERERLEDEYYAEQAERDKELVWELSRGV